MDNIIGTTDNAVIKLRLLYNDGRSFPADEACPRIYVESPRGRTEVQNFSITGEWNNIISWEMDKHHLFAPGARSISVYFHRNEVMWASVQIRDAFRVVGGYARHHCDHHQTIEITAYVNVIHDVDGKGALNVIFPTLEVNDDMHLILRGDVGNNHLFTVNKEGHLIYKEE